MAEVVTTYHGKSVKDVPAEAFIKAFSAYLKSTGKVKICIRLWGLYLRGDDPQSDCKKEKVAAIERMMKRGRVLLIELGRHAADVQIL